MKPELMERILSKCIEDGDCLVWQGSSAYGKHPQMSVDGKCVPVRRLMHEHKFGKLPPGKVAAHVCETRNCICHTEALTTSEVAKRVGESGAWSTISRRVKIAEAKRAASHITPEQVEAIRAAETWSQAAELTGLSEWAVKQIRGGRRWADLRSPFASLMARTA